MYISVFAYELRPFQGLFGNISHGRLGLRAALTSDSVWCESFQNNLYGIYGMKMIEV